jgi:hypothetical protein
MDAVEERLAAAAHGARPRPTIGLRAAVAVIVGVVIGAGSIALLAFVFGDYLEQAVPLRFLPAGWGSTGDSVAVIVGLSALGTRLPIAAVLRQLHLYAVVQPVVRVQPVVDKMLELARVGKNDTLFDLDPARIAEAKQNAKQAGVSDRAQFRVGDLFKTDFSSATVVTLYLLPTINAKLRPQLWKQFKIGTRLVSHAFDMGAEWPAEKTAQIDERTMYYWTVAAANKR